MSNLPFLSKLLEKVLLHQLYRRLVANNLSDRAHHSTQKALQDVMNCHLGSVDECWVSILTCSICQLCSTCWTPASSVHIYMACLAYLARRLNGFRRICLRDSSLSASLVGFLHRWSFVLGFLKVQSWALFSLLCMPSHCLASFPKVGAIITNLLTTLSFTSRLHLTFTHRFTTWNSVLTVGR